MQYRNIFKRYEIKYLVTDEQKKAIFEAMEGRMCGDEWGRSNIRNIYFDTPDFLLIRRSIEKPVYKEKLRLRSYGAATPDSVVFAEIKKKYDRVVYKRRIKMTEKEAMEYLTGGECRKESQISHEIDWFLKYYTDIAPRVRISYDREAFFDIHDSDFRITFDTNILWRDTDLSLCSENGGNPLLPENTSLMVIKTAGAIPLWLVHKLTELGVYKVSFSKYGNAYKEIFNNKMKEGKKHA